MISRNNSFDYQMPLCQEHFSKLKIYNLPWLTMYRNSFSLASIPRLITLPILDYFALFSHYFSLFSPYFALLCPHFVLFCPHFAFSVSILRFGYQWKQARPFQCITCKKVLVFVISPNTTERFTLEQNNFKEVGVI